MKKLILAALTVMFGLSTPAFASSVIYQEEPAAGSEQDQGRPDKD